ncbi:MAG: hypothetical protein JWR79_1849 [Tardiphaga sp.]|nr:hypothetical protein [Tardiphaga sp.]
MNIIADTNVLLRAIVRDDPAQAIVADVALRNATQIVLTLQTLCEFVWVLKSRYRRPRPDIAATIRQLMLIPNVVADRRAVAAGLAIMDAGGDFADGIINHEGLRQSGDLFVTFDVIAAGILTAAGNDVTLLTVAT